MSHFPYHLNYHWVNKVKISKKNEMIGFLSFGFKLMESCMTEDMNKFNPLVLPKLFHLNPSFWRIDPEANFIQSFIVDTTINVIISPNITFEKSCTLWSFEEETGLFKNLAKARDFIARKKCTPIQNVSCLSKDLWCPGMRCQF